MDSINFELAEKRSGIDILGLWLPRIAIAAVFLGFGYAKFNESGMYSRIFDQIGFGDWFRYLAGVMEMAGGVMVLIPWTLLLGVAMLAATMLGAMAAWMFVLGDPSAALFPGALLAVVVFVGVRAQKEKRRSSEPLSAAGQSFR